MCNTIMGQLSVAALRLETIQIVIICAQLITSIYLPNKTDLR